ncbi:hypothetical protein [Paenibacillus sambharensis]|uniref:hypothetical protein n=1 Tax=Paenibacillus sambharensis TaxID=1803190 RepID=UPI0011B545A6|nr:hypothetical protein [Paenibacillus sambharensis]
MSSQSPYEFKVRHVILLFLALSVPFSLLNFSAYLKGNMPSISQALYSTVFILLWFGCAFFLSNKNVGIKAASWFWGGGALLLIPGYFGIFNLPVLFIFAGSLYGLRYFIGLPSDMNFALIGILIAYGVTLMGWLLGKLKGSPQ